MLRKSYLIVFVALLALLASVPGAYAHTPDGADATLLHLCIKSKGAGVGTFRDVGFNGTCNTKETPAHPSLVGGGGSEWTDAGTLLHPADLSGAETVVIGGTTAGGADIVFNPDGSAVFNEQANDADFRIEGLTDSDLFVVDASEDRVGIGTVSPNEQLEITGNFRLPGSTSTDGVIFSDGSLYIHNFGTDNFFAGVNAGNLTMTGAGGNTGVGDGALLSNSNGRFNTAVGNRALTSNTTGQSNTAVGNVALRDNTGSGNTAAGGGALSSNTSGDFNTAIGAETLNTNTSGELNTAIGVGALTSNSFGDNNTAVGVDALTSNTTGSDNTALGFGTDVGASGLTNATAIGANAVVDVSNKIRLGDDSVTEVETNGDFHTTNGSFIAGATTTYGDGTITLSGGTDLNVDSNTLVVDNANNRVGIGTSTPSEQLQITGNFELPASTPAVGVIKSDGNRFIHNFGTDNFFAGVNAGNLTTTGQGFNTGVGAGALLSNMTGNKNTAVGRLALTNNTTGNDNTAVGEIALEFNSTGESNTAVGKEALSFNSTGDENTVVGRSALEVNSTGDENTVIGVGALRSNTTGSRNIAIGVNVGQFLTTGDDNIDIGNVGVAAESDTIRIGTGGTHDRTFIAGISGVTVASGLTVEIDSVGQLGTVASSRRFKKEIRDMADATDDLMELRPVMFTYKSDATGRTQYGLIAEEVAEVYPELVVRSADGQIESVRYHLLSSMLLNELQQQHQAIARKDAQIADLEARLAAVEQSLGLTEATGVPLSSIFSGTSMIWMIGAGMGLFMGGPGLVLGYRRFRGSGNELG